MFSNVRLKFEKLEWRERIAVDFSRHWYWFLQRKQIGL